MEKLPIDRELDSRTSNGLTVSLFLRPNTLPAETYVTVEDTKAKKFYMRDVHVGEMPHDVYYHPFAYIDTEVEVGVVAPETPPTVESETHDGRGSE